MLDNQPLWKRLTIAAIDAAVISAVVISAVAAVVKLATETAFG